ncbi:MAG: hypothetical protein LKG27_08115 [Clostridiaceae bacterium]|nr:hypothetical protein [Clostridiaceae bacterium]
MYLDINSTSNKPNFGMAIHSNPIVNKAIKARIKNADELQKLQKIIEKQAKNDKVDITLMINPGGKTISANAYQTAPTDYYEHNVFKRFSENTISKMFGGVVGFIGKVANYADKQALKLTSKDNLDVDSVLNKITD